jgi:sec-independent protein translocase protein TatA
MFGLFNLGGGEIILILLLVLILFGAKKLPELAKGLGQGIKEFKKATKEVTDEIHNAVEENHYSAPPPRQIEQPMPVTEPTEPAKPESPKVEPVPQSNEQKA